MARRQAGYEMDQQAQAYEAQQRQAQRHIEEQQRQIEALKQQKQNPQPPQEDLAHKLKKYADLKQLGVLTEEEFLKLKANLLSKI